MNIDLASISVEIILASLGLLVLMLDLFIKKEDMKWVLALVAIVGIIGAGYANHQLFGADAGAMRFIPDADNTPVGTVIPSESFTMGWEGDGPVIVDNFTIVFRDIFLLGLALTILLSMNYVKREGMAAGEYYALLIFCTLGMMVMAAAGDLLTLFLGLETLSIPVYVLAGFQRERIRSNEAGLKYLLIGAFASSFLLYGIAFIYGGAGTLNLSGIAEAASTVSGSGELSLYMIIGSALLLIGFAFKIAAVPFHMWTPDVYQGAPTSITAFMSVAVKAAAFAGLLRVLLVLIPQEVLMGLLSDSLWWIAVLTMTIGNLMALHQKSLKRMLAYSSISHAGYLLIGVMAAIQPGTTLNTLNTAIGSILYYLIAYTLMNIGAFGILILVARKGDQFENVEDFAGLAKRHPALAVGMTLFMLSLAGFPPTAGFFGKFFIFSAAVKVGLVPLVVIAVINSLISVFYYLGPVMAMYFKPSPEDEESRGLIEVPLSVEFTLYFTFLAVLALGLFPNVLIRMVSTVIGI